MSRITTTHTLTSAPTDLTVGEIRNFLDGVSDDATVSVRTDYPDRPGERGSITLTVNIPAPVSR